MDVEIHSEPSDGESGRELLAKFAADIARLYPGWTTSVGPSAEPHDFAPPRGDFLVAYFDGRPVGCVGLKRLDDEAVELKRLYVVDDLRGAGLARTLVRALEEAAAAAGYAIVRLDTGAKQPEAKRLFETSGYTAIADYNQNPAASYWFEKRLSPSSPASPRADSATA